MFCSWNNVGLNCVLCSRVDCIDVLCFVFASWLYWCFVFCVRELTLLMFCVLCSRVDCIDVLCFVFLSWLYWCFMFCVWLTLSRPAGHTCPAYKESFQVRWDNSIPLFLHAAIYLEVSLFRWISQNEFSRETAVLYTWYSVQCCMQHCTVYHLYSTAVSRENAFWLIQRNRDTSR